jgi:hypothetical protein
MIAVIAAYTLLREFNKRVVLKSYFRNTQGSNQIETGIVRRQWRDGTWNCDS